MRRAEDPDEPDVEPNPLQWALPDPPIVAFPSSIEMGYGDVQVPKSQADAEDRRRAAARWDVTGWGFR